MYCYVNQFLLEEGCKYKEECDIWIEKRASVKTQLLLAFKNIWGIHFGGSFHLFYSMSIISYIANKSEKDVKKEKDKMVSSWHLTFEKILQLSHKGETFFKIQFFLCHSYLSNSSCLKSLSYCYKIFSQFQQQCFCIDCLHDVCE